MIESTYRCGIGTDCWLLQLPEFYSVNIDESIRIWQAVSEITTIEVPGWSRYVTGYDTYLQNVFVGDWLYLASYIGDRNNCYYFLPNESNSSISVDNHGIINEANFRTVLNTYYASYDKFQFKPLDGIGISGHILVYSYRTNTSQLLLSCYSIGTFKFKNGWQQIQLDSLDFYYDYNSNGTSVTLTFVPMSYF